jgi:sugar lactone lactonase YvrE
VVPPTASPAPPQTPRGAATLRIPAGIAVLAQGFGGPDDLALQPDGSILFSDVGNGTVNRISPAGQVTTLLRGLAEPEGIVPLPDGTVLIVEQSRNRIVRWQPGAAYTLAVWLELVNRTGRPGVDGIVRDSRAGDIIIPDSPNGRLLRVDASGKNVRVVATGFVRPTGADVEPDGSILVADEYGNTVKRVRPDGRVESLGRFATPDDVVRDADGNIFVASLGDNSVRVIDPRGAVKPVDSVRSPQGLVLDTSGELIVAEAGLNRIVRLQIR